MKPKLRLLKVTGLGTSVPKVLNDLSMTVRLGPLPSYLLTCLVPLTIPLVTKWLVTLQLLTSGPQQTCFPSVLASLRLGTLDNLATHGKLTWLNPPSEVASVLLGELIRSILLSEKEIGRLKTLDPANRLPLICLNDSTLCFEVLTRTNPMPRPVPRPLKWTKKVLQQIPRSLCTRPPLARLLVLQAQSPRQVLWRVTHKIVPLPRLTPRLNGTKAVLHPARLPNILTPPVELSITEFL